MKLAFSKWMSSCCVDIVTWLNCFLSYAGSLGRQWKAAEVLVPEVGKTTALVLQINPQLMTTAPNPYKDELSLGRWVVGPPSPRQTTWMKNWALLARQSQKSGRLGQVLLVLLMSVVLLCASILFILSLSQGEVEVVLPPSILESHRRQYFFPHMSVMFATFPTFTFCSCGFSKMEWLDPKWRLWDEQPHYIGTDVCSGFLKAFIRAIRAVEVRCMGLVID